MILTSEMRNGFIDYGLETEIREKNYENHMYDILYVYWKKRTIFGVKEICSKFDFKRDVISEGKKQYWRQSNRFAKFRDDCENIKNGEKKVKFKKFPAS